MDKIKKRLEQLEQQKHNYNAPDKRPDFIMTPEMAAQVYDILEEAGVIQDVLFGVWIDPTEVSID
jgi:hypothetical protein